MSVPVVTTASREMGVPNCQGSIPASMESGPRRAASG